MQTLIRNPSHTEMSNAVPMIYDKGEFKSMDDNTFFEDQFSNDDESNDVLQDEVMLSDDTVHIIPQNDDYLSSKSDDDLIGDLIIDHERNISENMIKLHKNNKRTKSLSLERKSYSESNISLVKKIANKKRKSFQSSQSHSFSDHDDELDEEEEDELYSKYVEMKRKYHHQRRISQQFQEKITTIQDDNEDQLIATEENIKNKFEDEYEIKLIQLEQEKLNKNTEIEEVMKLLEAQNKCLLNQNKQLQQQVINQSSTITQQIQQQNVLQRQMSSASGAPSLGRRVSFISDSSFHHINNALNLNSLHSTPSVESSSPSRTLDGDNLPQQIMLPFNNNSGSSSMDDNLKFINYNINNDNQSQQTLFGYDHDQINDIVNNSYINMDPATKYNRKVNFLQINKKNKNKKYKKNKYHDLEAKLIENNDELKQKLGNGVTPWDRFWDLMTPDFCSCSPPNKQIKAYYD